MDHMRCQMLPRDRCPCSLCRTGKDHPDRVHHVQFRTLMSVLDERQRRWIAGWEAARLGYGGTRLVAQITGLDPKTIRRGRSELTQGLAELPTDRIRRPGAGRPPAAPRAMLAGAQYRVRSILPQSHPEHPGACRSRRCRRRPSSCSGQ
jgi:hypothetical protein